MRETRQEPIDAKAGPVRMCVVCRQRFLKPELLRHTLTPEGALAPDAGPASPGRGWYVCRGEECRRKFARFRPAPRSKGRK